MTYNLGAMDALRERPDVVLIGEIRDEETARECVSLSEAGPLVFASIHAKSPELGLWKMHRLLGATEQTASALSQVLKGVLYQTLLTDPENERYHLATETITVNKAIAELIEKREFGSVRPLIKSTPGCNTLNDDLNRLTTTGKITYADAERVTTDRVNFELEVGRGN